MHYSRIKFCNADNGIGIRTALFVSGCRNRCEGCFQPETWSFENGFPYTEETESEIIESIKPDWINGLAILGGEPFEEENQPCLLPLMRKAKQLPGKDIWVFTGYLLQDLLEGGRKHMSCTDEILSLVDVLVDGPFVLAKRNVANAFRGSENQRIIDMSEYRRTGRISTLFGS